MAVYLPCYCSREDVKSAADIFSAADYNAHIDSAIQAAVPEINGLCKRRFYNVIETAYFDWPNYQYAYPWRIWLDERELADVTALVPVVTTGGQSIPDSAIFWGPWNYAPPYNYLELDRSQSYAFGVGDTPQRDVAITGNFGYWTQTRPAGALAAAVSDTTSQAITVTNSAVTGVGDTIIVDSESMLVSDKAYSDTGQAQTGDGCTTDLASDNLLTVGDGSDIYAGELLQLDGEVMLSVSVTGNVITVIRAYDGSVLAAHSGAEVYAGRALTVLRGQFGTTAATHDSAAPVSALLYPPEVRELAIAESLNIVAQKTSAWARTLGENTSAVPGAGLPDLRDKCYTAHGRKGRQRVI
jgi:hypothetical protein